MKLNKFQKKKVIYNIIMKRDFNKQLSNGKMICLLRHSSNDDETTAFICYENEYWIKDKIEDNG